MSRITHCNTEEEYREKVKQRRMQGQDEMPDTDRERPERCVQICLKDQDGLRVTFHTFVVRTRLPNDKILDAIKAASQDFLNTPEGRKIWEYNCHNFNYGDFVEYVPHPLCIAHGFTKEIFTSVDIVDDDFNTTLAEPEEEDEEE